MRYDDGVEIDDNNRVMECPRCRNDEFSDRAEFCRICGLILFNRCEGYFEQRDYNGNGDTVYHDNPGNARFCESCGSKTQFYMESILRPWDKPDNSVKSNGKKTSSTTQAKPQEDFQTLAESIDDDDLPF